MKISNKFWIIDLETTGLDVTKCSILSLTILIISDRKIIKIINMRTNLSCPKNHISYNALKEIGDHTEQQVLDVFKLINDSNKLIMGWGLFYEIKVFRHKKIKFTKNYLDLMVIFRKKLNLSKNPSLGKMCIKYKISLKEELHTSLGDTLRIFKLLQLLWKG